MRFDCDFLFAALAEKHNAVIRRIREIPPWEWGGEFLELEPQVLRFLGTSVKRYPECAAFKTAYTLASALAVYRLDSRRPKTLSKQERADGVASIRNYVKGAFEGLGGPWVKGRNYLLVQAVEMDPFKNLLGDVIPVNNTEDALRVCGYDAESRSIDLNANDAGYANFALQVACIGDIPVSGVRNGILNAAIVPTRRAIRANGGSFVGKEGAKLVKERLDALATELNAPRFAFSAALSPSRGFGAKPHTPRSRSSKERRLRA